MNILVTGSRGRIGSELVAYLDGARDLTRSLAGMVREVADSWEARRSA